MSRRGPSLTALLGLLAVAGFQHREKISDLVRKVQSSDTGHRFGSGMADQTEGLLGGSPVGATLRSAINELVGMFQGTPHQQQAESWVSGDQNIHVTPDELEAVIGHETLAELQEKTGMTRIDLLAALSKNLPNSVDEFTPHGRLPTDDEAGGYV